MTGKPLRGAVRRAAVTSTASADGLPKNALYNYSSDAGRGSDTFAGDPGASWRRALLGGVAASAMWAALPRPAAALSGPPVNCEQGSPSDILNCSGDQSAGLNVPSQVYTTTINTVNVKDLTKDITPPSGTPGIVFFAYDKATLNSDLGKFKITTTGTEAHGINITAPNGVTIVHSGDISTSGADADAVSAFSDNGNVSVTTKGNINTTGESASGIRAASSYGGVNVNHTGSISALGDFSNGISASASSKADNVSVTSAGNITVGRFGNGITASVDNDATVTVTSTGAIKAGDNSEGINATADSYSAVVITTTGDVTVGAGGAAITAYADYRSTIEVTSKGNLSAGQEGAGIAIHNGYGGSTTINSTGNISTGADGVGIYASTGGGRITINSTGNIVGGAGSSGIVAISGGNQKKSFVQVAKIGPSGGEIAIKSVGNITLTGTSGDSGFENQGNAGILAVGSGGITIDSAGNISTGGDRRDGITAVSYNDNNYCYICDAVPSIAGVSVVSAGNITTTGGSSNAISAYGQERDVMVTSTGDLTTKGDYSRGIDAYSYYGRAKVTSKGNITTSGRYAHGIEAGTGYQGATVTSTGNIKTSGVGADGIQAFGHQEGNFGDCKLGKGCNDTNDDVTVTSTGNITTKGQDANGIFAGQDESGSGNVVVNSTGDISASGRGSSGIRIENSAGSNTVNILGGTVSGGTNTTNTGRDSIKNNKQQSYGAAGVSFFDWGSKNTVNNQGTITGGGSGNAIIASGSSQTVVNNSGIITGNVDLINLGGNIQPDRAANPHANESQNGSDFNNLAGGTFNSGERVQLGDNGTLSNDGTLNAGGEGKVGTTSVWGKIVQSSKGVLAVDIDHTKNTADRINVIGQGGFDTKGSPATANLSGKVAANLLNFDIIKPDKNFTILSAEGGVTHAGLKVVDTALVDYSLLYPNANDVVLSMNTSFNVSGLTPNQNAVLDYFGRGVGQGMPPELEAAYLALLNAKDAATVAAITDQLYSSTAGAAAAGGVQSGDALALSMRSCPVAEGPYGQLRETSCVWAKPTARRFNQDRDTDTADIRDTTVGISGGFQAAVAENTWAGLGVSLENSDTEINTTTKTDGTWWQIGGVAKWTQGPWKLSSSISGGQGDIDVRRGINIPGINDVAVSGTDIGLVKGLTRLSYSFGATGFYVTPMLDIGFSYVDVDGYTERGAGALNLIVSSSDQWLASGGAGVEIGSTIITETFTYRPYIKAGVTVLSDDNFTTQARFINTPAGVAPFKIDSHFDDVYADVSAGIQMFGGQGLNLRLNYDGRFGENSEQHGIDGKLTVNY